MKSLVLVAGLSPFLLQESDLDDAVRGLVERLGSSVPFERDEASDALEKLGEKARAFLSSAQKDPDAEIRIRARLLLRRLDLKRDSRTHATAVGDLGAGWLERRAYPLLRTEGALPQGLSFPLSSMLKNRSLYLILVRFDDDRISNSQVVQLTLAPGSNGLRHNWWRGEFEEKQYCPVSIPARPSRTLAAGDFFRLWPRLETFDLLFLCPAERNALRRSIEAGLKHRRPLIRAASAHALRFYYDEAAVDSALIALDDKESMVRRAAADALKVIAEPPGDDAPSARKRWQGLDAHDRRRMLDEQFLEIVMRKNMPGHTGCPDCLDVDLLLKRAGGK